MGKLKDCFELNYTKWCKKHTIEIDTIETLELIREALKDAACEAMSTEMYDDATKLMYMVRMIDEYSDEREWVKEDE